MLGFRKRKPDPSRPDLPRWASWGADGFIEVDPDKAYPRYLKKLGNADADQYWLEVARRCFTEDLRVLRDQHPEYWTGRPLNIRILRGSGRWRLALAPRGRGADAGSAEFRRHYRRL